MFEELPIIIAAKCGWRDLVHTLLNHTDQIEGVEWSIDGLIGYVTSEGFLEKVAFSIHVCFDVSYYYRLDLGVYCSISGYGA